MFQKIYSNKKQLAFLASALVLISSLLLPVIKVNAANVTLNIDGNTHYQTMDGFGVNANPSSWTGTNGSELTPTLDMLADGGTTIWRVPIDDQDWEAVNDDSDPNHFNWNYYNSVMTTPRMEKLWSLISYLNQKPNSKVILCPMGKTSDWMGGVTLTTTDSNENEYAETIAALAYYGHITRGLNFILEPNNEPDILYEGVRMQDSDYAIVANKIAQKLDTNGLSDMEMMGPSAGVSFYNVTKYTPFMWQYPALMTHVHTYSIHDYDGTTNGADASIKSSPYPTRHFYMTEFAQFIDGFAELGEGPTGLLVWDGYDSAYTHPTDHGSQYVAPNDASHDGPALFSYNSTSHTYAARKEYFQFGQLFKYIPGGSVRIGTSSSNSGVGAYTFTHTPSGRVTIVGNNTTTSSQTLTIALNNVSNLPSNLNYYQTNSTSNMTQGANVAVSAGTATVTVPANTIFTLTGTGITDTQAPSDPTSLSATGSIGSASLSWTASTDNVGVSQYNVYRSTTSGFTPSAANKVGQSATTTFNNAGLSAGTYYYKIIAQDSAGNISGASNEASADVTSDTLSPTVSISSPASGATVSGATTVSASASDNVGVAGVQFKVDGTNIGSEVTASPYSTNWDTTFVSNGSHVLTAVARDASGNSVTSSNVTVTVNNISGALLLGNQAVQSSLDSNASGSAEAFKYTASSSGSAGALKFYVDSGSAATSLKVGVYSSNGTHPGTLLTSGVINSPASAAWNTATLSPSVQLTSGTTYWIGFLGTGGTLKYRDASSGSCSESASGTGLSALPATWTSGSAWPSCNLSAYVVSGGVADTQTPTTSITAPIGGSTVGGNQTITANASDNVGVTKVEWFLDGTLQTSDTTSPYSFNWNTAAATNGSHQLTTKAYDSAGNIGSSAAVTVTVFNDNTAPTVPADLNAVSGGMTQAQLSWSASSDNVGVTGYHVWRNGTQVATTATTSFTDTNLSAATVYSYTISAFDAAGNESAQSSSANVTTDSDTTAPTAPTNLTQTASSASTATVSWSASSDNVAVSGYGYYNGGLLPIGSTSNTNITFTGLSCGTTYAVAIDAFDAAGNRSTQATLQINTDACDTTAPLVSLSAPLNGATISGANVTVSADASDNVGVVGVQFKLDGVNLASEDTSAPYSVTWNSTTATNGSHTLTAIARDAAGNSTTSVSVQVTVNNTAAPITVDKQVTTHQTPKGTSITSPTFTTTQGNELLVAFITSDGSNNSAQSFSSVTGGGLTWTLRKRVNTQQGTSEIWTASAVSVLTNASVTATRANGSYVGSITVATFKNANLTTIGAVGGANATTGAPSASLTATQTGSVVWGVGNDWDRAVAHTAGSGQTMVDQYLATVGDSFWVQSKDGTSTTGQIVTISDTAPTTDRWNLATIEILPQ
jgi:chitodextrinase